MSVSTFHHSLHSPAPVPPSHSVDEEEDPALEELDKKVSGSVYITNRVVVTSEGTLDPSQLTRTEGYMWKKGGAVNARGGFRNWKKRWFVLVPVEFLGSQGYELQYYDGPNGSLKGKVGLNDVDLHCEKKSHKNSKKLVKFEFQLILQNGGILELSCDSEEEREEWLETLGIIVTFLRKLTTSNVMTLNGYDPLCEDDVESFRLGDEIAQNCQAFGPGLFGVEAGKLTQFLVQVYDVNGQKVTMGGMPVTATIENDVALYHLSVQDHEDGTYSSSYTLGRSGKYKLNVTLNEEHHVFGSPFEIEVLPSKTLPSACRAEGEALLKLPMKQVSSFTIIAVDSYGNRKLRGGDPFEIGIMGPAQLLQLTDNDDGSYTCAIEVLNASTTNPAASSSGNLSNLNASSVHFPTIMIMITLYGKPIQGSPFKPTIIDTSSSSTNVNAATSAKNGANKKETTPQNPKTSVTPATERAEHSKRAKASATPSEPLKQPQPTSPINTSAVDVSQAQAQAKVKASASVRATPNHTNHTNQPSSLKAVTTPNDYHTADLTTSGMQSPVSRLERSRQRALLAKSLSEANPATAAVNHAFSGNANASVMSSHFGVPLHTLLKSDETTTLAPPPAPPVTTTLPNTGSKLTQLAQRNAASLQALKLSHAAATPQENFNPDVTASAPSPKPSRTTGNTSFLSELANNLRQGLGKMNASLNSSSTPVELELWDNTHRALTDDRVIEKLLQHVDTLTQLFSLFADRVEGVSVIKLITSKGHGGIYRLLELYEIIPNFLSKAETKVLYNRILLAQRALKLPASIAGGGSAIEFSSFLRLLIMVAIFTLSKTDLLATHYSTTEAKLDVLLYKWGLADGHRLTMIRQLLLNQGPTDI